jgi:NADH-quinone oxidoreductase subunit N
MIQELFPMTSLTGPQLSNLLPLFLLSFGAVISLLVGTSKHHGHRNAFIVALVTLIIAIVQNMSNIFTPELPLLGGSLMYTAFTKTLGLMALFFALIGVILTYGQDQKEGLLSEIYALIMFSTCGMILMMSTTHLLFMFIALEIMSLAVYVMVTMRRSSSYSAEAGLKYFILGGLASALFLYGSSLVFGATGSFELVKIEQYLKMVGMPSFIFFFGLGLILVGMLFKVGAFPFHGWVPDVYQGASTNVTAFMGAAVKFTAFMALANVCRHMVFVEGVQGLYWFGGFIWIVSAWSMVYGNFVAISQNEIKRMLSFSTIAHTGYLLIGLYAMSLNQQSIDSLVLYLFFYALANLGAFAVIAAFEKGHEKDLTFDQMAGLGIKHPFMGLAFAIFLFSMAGIPLTSGFIAKYSLFSSAVNAGEIPLVVLAVLTSVVSVYYYLRVIVYMFMKEADGNAATYQSYRGAAFAAMLSAAATIQFGIFPRGIIHFLKLLSR